MCDLCHLSFKTREKKKYTKDGCQLHFTLDSSKSKYQQEIKLFAAKSSPQSSAYLLIL